MGRIYNNFSDLIGNTPLLELHNYSRNRALGARIAVKIEYFNPAGSIKDRIAKAIVAGARGKVGALPAVEEFTNVEGLGVQGIVDGRAVVVRRAEHSNVSLGDLAPVVTLADPIGHRGAAYGGPQGGQSSA